MFRLHSLFSAAHLPATAPLDRTAFGWMVFSGTTARVWLCLGGDRGRPQVRLDCLDQFLPVDGLACVVITASVDDDPRAVRRRVATESAPLLAIPGVKRSLFVPARGTSIGTLGHTLLPQNSRRVNLTHREVVLERYVDMVPQREPEETAPPVCIRRTGRMMRDPCGVRPGRTFCTYGVGEKSWKTICVLVPSTSTILRL